MNEAIVSLRCVAVVEDEQPVRKALERLLRSAGFSVRSFDSGAAFLDSLGEFQPSCVVLDLHMPPPNGFDVLEILHRGESNLAIVVISAEHSSHNCTRVRSCGAKSFLAKPVDEALLLDAVETAMRAQGQGQ
ncbi:MAG: response regulator transcription factor [Burkholderiales bacterium]